MTIFLILEIVVVTLAVVYNNKAGEISSDFFHGTITSYGSEGREIESQIIDDMQWLLKCCGVYDKDEWLSLPANKTYAASCCADFDGRRSKVCDSPYEVPCFTQVDRLTRPVINYIAAGAGTLGLIQLLAVIASFTLIHSFRKHYNLMPPTAPLYEPVCHL